MRPVSSGRDHGDSMVARTAMVYGNSNANEEFLRLTYQADMNFSIAAYLDRHAAVAQLEERQVSTLQVTGSIPVRRSKIVMVM